MPKSRALDDMLFRTQFQEIKGKKLGDISKFDINYQTQCKFTEGTGSKKTVCRKADCQRYI